MPLLLAIHLPAAAITVFDGLKVEVQLQNTDTEPCTVPSPEDRSAAITLVVYATDGKVVRRINGITSQLMRSTGRVNTTPQMDRIQPLETWQWTMDAARFHYSIPAGEYALVLEVAVPAQRLVLRSNMVALRVSPARLTSIHARRDNPVIHRLDALMKWQLDDGSEFACLRQWNPFRPLAAMYSERIPIMQGAANLHTAAANFFQAESFDPLAQCWVVWRKEGEVQAVKLAEGRPTGGARRAALPKDRQLAGNSFYTFDDRLFVWLLGPSGDWELWELEERAMRPLLRHRVRMQDSPFCSVAADPTYIHFLTAQRGLLYEKLTYSGEVLEQRRLVSSRLRPHSCRIEPDRGRAIAMFWNGAEGKSCELICARLEQGAAAIRTPVALPLRHTIDEVSFDFDRHGRYHLLVSTAKRRLYYVRGERMPMLVADGEARFFPLVVAPSGAYLGWHSREHGFRLLPYTGQAHAPKLQTFDLAG